MASEVEMESGVALIQQQNQGEIDGVGPSETEHYYQTMFPELYQVLTASFVQNTDLPADKSEQVIGETLKALATYQGGRAWYLGRSKRLERVVRDIEIYRLQGKKHIAEIAFQFDITSAQARTIANQVTKNRKLYGLP